jgi:hypothetical protein
MVNGKRAGWAEPREVQTQQCCISKQTLSGCREGEMWVTIAGIGNKTKRSEEKSLLLRGKTAPAQAKQ